MKVEFLYKTPRILQLVELAGRTCYRSEDRITETSAEGFVARIVGRGHESVIEHSNLVFHISDIPPEAMLKALQLNRFITCLPKQDDTYYLSGNTRMFKDLIRAGKAYLTDVPDSDFGEFLDALMTQLYQLPKSFFVDFVEAEWMAESGFPQLPMEGELQPRLVHNKGGQTVELLNLDSPGNWAKGLSMPELEQMLTCTVRVKTSRDSSLQEVRHRPAAYSQESQRYVDLQDHLDYIHPAEIPLQQRFAVDICRPSKTGDETLTLELTFDEMMQLTHRFYIALRQAGYIPEVARGILPNATGTTIVITRTLTNWRHYLRLRTDQKAQRPIRERAHAILALLKENGWLQDLTG